MNARVDTPKAFAALLDAYADEGFAPKAFAALRDVLKLCDSGDKDSIGILDTNDVRAAITAALETQL